jgi:hypothetical protein
MADIYNAERLKEYCNWFFRRHASTFMMIDVPGSNDNQEDNQYKYEE